MGALRDMQLENMKVAREPLIVTKCHILLSNVLMERYPHDYLGELYKLANQFKDFGIKQTWVEILTLLVLDA